MVQNKKPQIRFKGFTDAWEQRKFENIFKVSQGLQIPISERYLEPAINRYFYITNEFLKDSCEKSYYIESPAENVICNEEDILMTRTGNTGIVVTDVKGCFHNNFFKIKYDKTQLSKRYICCLLSSDKMRKIILNSAGSSTIPDLSHDSFYKIEGYFPKQKVEQDKIGQLFKSIDNLITIHQFKLDKLVKIKNTLLEKMFPKNNNKVPEIRFKGFFDEWEEHKLDDFGKSTGGISIESEFSEDGKYKVISIGSYSESSTYNDQGIRCKLSNRTKDRILNKDDIAMILNDKTSSGNIIGRVLLIDKSGLYVYNQRTERIEIDKKEYDPLFIYELLNAPNIRKKIIKESQGNTQIYVNWTKIKELIYYVPNIEEQRKLGVYLKNIDNLIMLYQCKLDKIKKVKKTIQRKMLV